MCARIARLLLCALAHVSEKSRPMATEVNSPFFFIQTDVTRQRELATQLVHQVEALDAIIVQLERLSVASEVVNNLKVQRGSILAIARHLGMNANVTSNTAASVIRSST